MAKRLICALLAAALLFSAGCSAFAEKEYVSEVPHDSDPVPVSEAVGTIEVSNYVDLKEAIMTFISAILEKGRIKFLAYSGNPKEDISSACMEIVNDTPIGAYAVYYIDYSLSQIVSYYEAEIKITYKKTPAQIVSIMKTEDENALRAQLIIAARRYKEELAISTDNPDIDPDAVTRMLDEIYYASPGSLYAVPRATVTEFPAGSQERILEVDFKYMMDGSILKERLNIMADYADEVLVGIKGHSDASLDYVARKIAGETQVVEKTASDDADDRWRDTDTAYGALIEKKASSEGISVAIKFFCNLLGIQCYVVRGLRNNAPYSWNIVKLEDGRYYHLDASRIGMFQQKIFKTDEEMPEGFWWNSASYPVCEDDAPPEPTDEDMPETTAPGAISMG